MNRTALSLWVSVPLLAGCAGSPASLSDAPSHSIVPLGPAPQQGLEVVSGDPSTPGTPFVIRIHNDAGYTCAPHTHPTDEHIVVVRGRWSVGMGTHLDTSSLEPLDLGAYGLVPAKMPHFCRSITATTLQVHGIGPFGIDLIDPSYELTAEGVSLWSVEGGTPVAGDDAAGCFVLAIGDRVRGPFGEGRVIGGECSRANAFTQYHVQSDTGERMWVPADTLEQ